MGNIQMLISHRCCNNDLEIDGDDDEKEKTKVEQLPARIRSNEDEIANCESFQTLPCLISE